MRLLAALAVSGLAIAPVAAQGAQPPRIIAPELFHPYSQGELGPREPPAPIVAPTRERPFGACVQKSHDWIACLTATAARSDGIVEDAEQAAVAALPNRRPLNPYLKKSYTEALSRLDAEWRKFRDAECDALAALENGLPPQVYEARLVCRIVRNLERGEALKSRYGGG